MFEAPSEKIEEAILNLFVNNGWTLSTAESCTGGSIASHLTKLPGSSKYFQGGFVCYSNSLKEKLLNVPNKIIDKYGSVSKETVTSMVLGLLSQTETTFGLAISGIAGPTGGSPEKPVGTVWIAVAKKKECPQAFLLQLQGNRDIIIERSVHSALEKLFQYCRMV